LTADDPALRRRPARPRSGWHGAAARLRPWPRAGGTSAERGRDRGRPRAGRHARAGGPRPRPGHPLRAGLPRPAGHRL